MKGPSRFSLTSSCIRSLGTVNVRGLNASVGSQGSTNATANSRQPWHVTQTDTMRSGNAINPYRMDPLLPALTHSPHSTASLPLPPDPHASTDFYYMLFILYLIISCTPFLFADFGRDERFVRPLHVTYHMSILSVGFIKPLQQLVRDLKSDYQHATWACGSILSFLSL